jgi:hypothetical protein
VICGATVLITCSFFVRLVKHDIRDTCAQIPEHSRCITKGMYQKKAKTTSIMKWRE